ncbi:YicC family protein [Candidatus Dependentiae bacterium]|nr:YicC family protein [Candidatus Dependentiae bacterium]
MVLSMTGFSSTILEVGKIHLTMTLKSLNSRFFEVNCKLPYLLTHLETDIIKLCKAKLYRGNVYATVYMTNPHALTSGIEPSLTTVGGYLKALETIKQQFSLSGSVSVSDILTLPNIFEVKEGLIDEATTATIMQAISELIESLNQTRIQEGSQLAHDINQRIVFIKQYLEKLEPRAQEVLKQRKETLLNNFKAVLAENNQEVSHESQNMMIYSQLEKMDIHEEIVRFKTHLDSLTQCLESSNKEKGKKLDFTLQELFREINTIASKCLDATISSLAINIKFELEKAREQSQNIV